MNHPHDHRLHRVGWLRAAVMGANDGIVSTASLIIGVAAAGVGQSEIIVAGLAALVAGAMSMAAGEYVSVSSQSDTEEADLEMERKALESDYEWEQEELKAIYQGRGLRPELAQEVAEELMKHDALGAHARDELGIHEHGRANPLQAAISSALTFTAGAALPLFAAWVAPRESIIYAVSLLSLLFLAALGGMAARAGGASVVRGISRVTLWGALAMIATALVGRAFGVVV